MTTEPTNTPPSTTAPIVLNRAYKTYVSIAVTILVLAVEQIGQNSTARQDTINGIRQDVAGLQRQVARIESKLDRQNTAAAPGPGQTASYTPRD